MNPSTDAISVFGASGFVGSWFCADSIFLSIPIQRDVVVSETPSILYLISTTHNYHVHNEPRLDIQTNQELLIEILEMNRKNFGLEEINFISSWFVYGNTDIPAREDSCCDPHGFYSITKHAAEQMLASYCETFGLNYRILRLANVMGVGDMKVSRKKNATQYMVKELAQGRPVDYLYRGRFLRDFIDVRDVVRAIDLVLEHGELNQIYNIGNGVGYAISDIIEYAAKKTKNYQVKLIDHPKFHKTVQVDNMYLDNTKLRELGYRPQYDILETLDWLIEHYEQDPNS